MDLNKIANLQRKNMAGKGEEPIEIKSTNNEIVKYFA